MRLTHLSLRDFRNYEVAELDPAPHLTVVVGPNGEGKTNLLEAIGYLATLSSFRGVPNEALVRDGASSAVVRADLVRRERELLVEAEVVRSGRGRVALNRQAVRRHADLRATVRATVFSPDDLVLVKGGPAERRRYLDDLLSALHAKYDAAQADYERVLRQRNSLLKQVAGRLGGRTTRSLSPDEITTLEVWDTRLVATGEALADARAWLVDALGPWVSKAYDELAGSGQAVAVSYEAPWRDTGLADALANARAEELRRGVSLVGPHRDDLGVVLGGRPARTHASQGEQRGLALALRLAGHQLVGDTTGDAPMLLLDDVFSELDDRRSDALVAHLPSAQAVLTTAGRIPTGTEPELVVRVAAGRLETSS